MASLLENFLYRLRDIIDKNELQLQVETLKLNCFRKMEYNLLLF